MDEHFEAIVHKRSYIFVSKYYGEDNPLITLKKNTEDLVASAVVKIASNDELVDGILSQFDSANPDFNNKADNFYI